MISIYVPIFDSSYFIFIYAIKSTSRIIKIFKKGFYFILSDKIHKYVKCAKYARIGPRAPIKSDSTKNQLLADFFSTVGGFISGHPILVAAATVTAICAVVVVYKRFCNAKPPLDADASNGDTNEVVSIIKPPVVSILDISKVSRSDKSHIIIRLPRSGREQSSYNAIFDKEFDDAERAIERFQSIGKVTRGITQEFITEVSVKAVDNAYAKFKYEYPFRDNTDIRTVAYNEIIHYMEDKYSEIPLFTKEPTTVPNSWWFGDKSENLSRIWFETKAAYERINVAHGRNDSSCSSDSEGGDSVSSSLKNDCSSAGVIPKEINMDLFSSENLIIIDNNSDVNVNLIVIGFILTILLIKKL